MDEKEKNLDTEIVKENEPETEEKAEISAETLAAQEKMEQIFKKVSEKKPVLEQEEKTQEVKEEDKVLETKSSEIELMTVQKLTDEDKVRIEEEKEAAEKQKQVTFIKKLVAAVFLIIAVILAGFCYTDYAPGKESGEVIVTVPEGSSTKSIARILKKDGLIHSEFFYRVMSKLRGVDGNYNFGKFKLDRGDGYETIFKTLQESGHNLDAMKVTIPEGYEIYKIADLLERKGLIDKDKFYYLIDYGEFDYDFVKELPERENRLEGYLFPSTYQFAPGDEYGIINEMLMQFDRMYAPFKERAKEMGMTMDEVITLASIIEREALGDEDRDRVSSVFHNRLKSNDYPYLQSCATVQYVLKERKAVLSIEDTKIDSPYNTYINAGLPVGPIASPGEAAVKAALYPADTDYLFFVLGSDGKHHFSKTFSEHTQNKNN